jgi:hypothetical protein
MAKVILIVGRKKTGKSSFIAQTIKRVASGRPCFIYDKNNNEYKWKFGIENSYKGPIEDEAFIQAVTNLRGACIVYEEASTYLSGMSRSSNEARKIKNLITRSRHSNNILMLAFTSLSDVPPFVYSDSDYLCLYKTNDFSSALDSRFRKNQQFMTEYEKVKMHPDKHFFSFFEIT